MLILTYTRKNDKFQTISVIGDAAGIRDLYWQLTHNYLAQDGTEIGDIKVANFCGVDCTNTIMSNPYLVQTNLSSIDR
jgi:hypothetical protein